MEQFDIIYHLIYSTICILVLVSASSIDFKNNYLSVRAGVKIVGIFLTVYIFLFGFREINIGTDTASYQLLWDITNNFSFTSEFFTSALINFLKGINLTFVSFLLVYAIIFITTIYFAILKIGKTYVVNPLFILFVFVSLFFFKTMGINIIRQGTSLAFILLFILNFDFENWKKISFRLVLLGLIAFSIHNTSIICLLIIFFLAIFKKIRLNYYVFLYFISIILSYLSYGIHQILPNLRGFDERRVESYVEKFDDIFIVGFKPQFVLFNTIFLILFLSIKDYVKSINTQYEYVLKYYICISILFFLSFQMSYSDRWGIMSWIVLPYLIAPVFTGSLKMKASRTIFSFFLIMLYVFFSFYY